MTKVAGKDKTLTLIIGQLQYYGYNALAASVSGACGIPLSGIEPSGKLAEHIGRSELEEAYEADNLNDYDQGEGDNDSSTTAGDVMMEDDRDENEVVGSLSHFFANNNDTTTKTTVPSYSTRYITTHKGPVTATAISRDGKLVATGSSDATVKLMDTDKLLLQPTSETSSSPASSLVTKTYYDHSKTVTQLAFHPNNMVLASSSLDSYIKLYDLTKLGMKRSFRFLGDGEKAPVHSICFHPSGDYLIAGLGMAGLATSARGAAGSGIKLYDVKTLHCYGTAANDSESGGRSNNENLVVNSISFSPRTGSFFVAGSADGRVLIYDTLSMKPSSNLSGNALDLAHGGSPVHSVVISRNERFILTSGQDSIPKLWDMRNLQAPIVCYRGANHSTPASSQCIFDSSERFVLGPDDTANPSIACWDVRTGELLHRFTGHSQRISCLTSANTLQGPCFVSGSDDHRTRFWSYN